MSNRGLLIIYSGFSGVGKGTIMKEMLKQEKNFRLSVSATTRSPRPGEENGREYYFISKDEFETMIENNEFFEYAQYSDNYYGTPKKPVEEMLEQGLDVFLEIEVQGGLQMMEKRPDALSIFIVPPSIEELEARLRGRNTESEEVIQKRLSAVEYEKQFVSKYNVTVMNDKVSDAVNQVIDIVKKEKEKRNNNF